MLELNVIPFSLNPQAEDKVVWAFSSNGTFSFKDAYILAKGLDPLISLTDLDCSLIWKSCTSLRIKFFLWLCFHKSLPTCEVL
jgi:hypothetical protein